MSNPMTPVAGYVPLSTQELALMNENKLLEELVLRQIDRHRIDPQALHIDQRCVSVAATHFMEGFMALNRAVAKPTRLRPTAEEVEVFQARAEALIEKLLRT